MEKLVQSMVQLLERQNSVVMDLIDVGCEQMEVLKQEDTASMEKVIAKQQVLAETLTDLERKRLALQTELADRLDMEADSTLSELVASSPGGGGAELRKIAGTVRQNFCRLQEVNETNKLLIRQALGMVNRLLNWVIGEERAGYDAQGQVFSPAMAGGPVVDHSV